MPFLSGANQNKCPYGAIHSGTNEKKCEYDAILKRHQQKKGSVRRHFKRRRRKLTSRCCKTTPFIAPFIIKYYSGRETRPRDYRWGQHNNCFLSLDGLLSHFLARGVRCAPLMMHLVLFSFRICILFLPKGTLPLQICFSPVL